MFEDFLKNIMFLTTDNYLKFMSHM